MTQKALETGIYHGYFLTLLIALPLQLIGYWTLMILAGIAGGVTVKRYRHAFIAGFLGVATAWSIIFVFLNAFAQAYVIGEFFAALIGLPGFGRWIVSLSILIGGLLGASGSILGRAIVELIEEFRPKERID
ncbi:MAG: hypothetical protein ACXABV_19180 [Candidatus Thorarchaeota archaeon]